MVWRQTLIICTVLIVSLVKIQQVACSGVFELHLKSYTNERGRDEQGLCCSGERSGQCTGSCRTRFRVCLKHFQNVIDTKSACTFGDVRTAVLGDNNISLADASDMQTIKFPFDFSWPGWFSLIVEAWHDPTSSSSTSVVDAGVVSSFDPAAKLISQFPMQQELKISSTWTSIERRSNNSVMTYEIRVMCDEHYYGPGCVNLCRPRDDSFGHYTCSPTGSVKCLDGWKDDYCSKPVCLPGCDEAHGYCNKPGECLCHSGWKGRLCDECEPYPHCAHGTCQKPWDCLCDEGWGGLFCNQDLNYCTNHKPCVNGGTCFNTGQGSYTCSCPPGYTGIDCDKKLSDCSHKPCLNNATCKEDGNGYQCECSKGYNGKHCEVAVVTCEDKPCQHGGTCMDTIHGYKCSCLPGWSGFECQNTVNHCAPNPCANGGNCTTLSNNAGYKCSCPSGFTGANCHTNIDDCHGNPCQNGGSCIDQVNAYKCRCIPGFTGDHCEEKANMCLLNPCANGGTCKTLVNDFKCECRPGFTGKDCAIDVDECENNQCLNGGTCFNKGSGFQCECATGFTGLRCEKLLAMLPKLLSTASSQSDGGSAADTNQAVSTDVIGGVSRHVSVLRSAGSDDDDDGNGEGGVSEGSKDRSHGVDWYLIFLVSSAVPVVAVIAALGIRMSKRKRERERQKADEEARMQNEQNSVHSHVSKRNGDAHMIKNVWGQCAKNVDVEHTTTTTASTTTTTESLYYPKQVYAAVPADPNIALVYPLQRSRSQKQLNVDPPTHRHSMCHRASVKDLDTIVRTGTPAPLDNRLSTVSISISHSNLSDNSLSKQHCSPLPEKEKSVQNNTLNSSVLNGSICGSGNAATTAYVSVLDGGSFASTLFATEV